MNIFITGGAGFIGSNLADFLLSAGHSVKVLDDFSTGSRDNITQLLKNPHFELIEGCVTQSENVKPLMQWCDHCYHLAAPVGVKWIMEHPVKTILNNIRGIDVVMEATHTYNKKTLVASTSEVYGKSLDFLDPTGQAKLSEEDYRIEGSTGQHRWAYANTKAMDEFLALAYYKEFGTQTVVVRFFNTVGPRQVSRYGMVIPNFIEKALRNQPITIYGTGEQKRSFMHVKDAIRAITGLMNHPQAVGNVFNVGNPIEITINELARLVRKLCQSNSEIEYIPYEQAYGAGFEDMQRRTADITKLTRLLNFQIEYDLNSTLLDIINAGKKYVFTLE